LDAIALALYHVTCNSLSLASAAVLLLQFTETGVIKYAVM